MKHSPLFSLLALALFLSSCSTAYYAAMDKFGYEKRHILVDRVKKSKSSQVEAKERLNSLRAIQGKNLTLISQRERLTC